MHILLNGSISQDISRAADILRAGGLVAFPTETVYGLGADAANGQAVNRVFAAKGRPADHPLIVHVGRIESLSKWARDIPASAWRLAEQCWPGPLTLILKRHPNVPHVVTGGQETIGIRVPDHPVALGLLNSFGGGIAAPSANRFGRVSPTVAEHVAVELGEAIECILDGGPCAVGLESTILDLSGTRPRILRPGAVTPERLAETLGETPTVGGQGGPRVPGRLPVHYAPTTPLRLIEATALETVACELSASTRLITVLSMRPRIAGASHCRWWLMPADPKEYARLLYARLREADTKDCDCILVERPPASAAWEAVRDRLRRAAAAAAPEAEDLRSATSGAGRAEPTV